jgi:DnaJ-class molecular chaperone
MPLAYRQKPGWDYEAVTDDRDARVTEECDCCNGKGVESHNETCIKCGGVGKMELERCGACDGNTSTCQTCRGRGVIAWPITD